MEMHKSKYKEKVDKIKSIGVLKENNLNEEAALATFTKILNATIFRKKPIKIVNINELENILKAIDKKHNMYIGYIMTVRTKEKDIRYSFSLRLGNEHLDTVFTRTMLEGMCKSLLVLYYYIKLKEEE